MTIRTITINSTNGPTSRMWREASQRLLGIVVASQARSTTQPCHVVGGPQPQPYRFAGNQ
jgi:hypothetical protein